MERLHVVLAGRVRRRVGHKHCRRGCQRLHKKQECKQQGWCAELTKGSAGQHTGRLQRQNTGNA
eukprot:14487330-Alexandrium_andersonii.AAC.1